MVRHSWGIYLVSSFCSVFSVCPIPIPPYFGFPFTLFFGTSSVLSTPWLLLIWSHWKASTTIHLSLSNQSAGTSRCWGYKWSYHKASSSCSSSTEREMEQKMNMIGWSSCRDRWRSRAFIIWAFSDLRLAYITKKNQKNPQKTKKGETNITYHTWTHANTIRLLNWTYANITNYDYSTMNTFSN